MNRLASRVTVLSLLGLAALAGQVNLRHSLVASTMDEGPPLTSEPKSDHLAVPSQSLRASLQYAGTSAKAHPDLNADDPRMKQVCELFREADFIPEPRRQRFAFLDESPFQVVGWHLTVESMEVRQSESLIRVRAFPRLMLTDGGGSITSVDSYVEFYRLSGGKLHFTGGEPIVRTTATAIIID